MKKLKLLSIVILAVSLTACAQLLKIQGQAAEKIAQGIGEYCKNTDAAFREKFRDEVNAKAAPNSAAITCAPPAQ